MRVVGSIPIRLRQFSVRPLERCLRTHSGDLPSIRRGAYDRAMAEQLFSFLWNPYVTLGLALILVIGRMALYFRRLLVQKKGFNRRPILSEISVLLGFGLAVWTVIISPSWGVTALAVVPVVLGGFVLYLFSQGGVPKGVGVKVGQQAPSFSALDWDGGEFAYDAGQNDPLLLKFYRGHW